MNLGGRRIGHVNVSMRYDVRCALAIYRWILGCPGAGFAVLTALSAGDYQLKVQADAFSDYERPLTLTVGQVASVSAQLG